MSWTAGHLVADVDGLGLVAAVLQLDGHQVAVRRHAEVRPQRQHRLIRRVQGLQHSRVPGVELIFLLSRAPSETGKFVELQMIYRFSQSRKAFTFKTHK